jgi:hypothetical protein
MVLCGLGFSEAWQGVQGEREEGPPTSKPAGGLTRPWRTLTWLFLAGLRPRRAQFRFTRQEYSIREVSGEKPREKSQEETS